MITFKSFLNETVVASHDPEEAAKLVFKNCQPYLKQSGFDISTSSTAHAKNALLRGMRPTAADLASGIIKWDATRIRGPKDSSTALHELLDDYFIRTFGYPYRSKGVFCTGAKSVARSYGAINLVFPVGQFKYIWSPSIPDAFTAFERGGASAPHMESVIFEDMHDVLHEEFMSGWREDDGEPTQEHYKDFLNTKTYDQDKNAWFDLVDLWLEAHDPYRDTGLKQLLQLDEWSGGRAEVMLQCDEYYTVFSSSGAVSNTHEFPGEFAHHLNLLMKGKKE